MTPAEIRKLADAHDLLASFHNPNTKAVDAVTAPILIALADVVEGQPHCVHWVEGDEPCLCQHSAALARVEAIKP